MSRLKDFFKKRSVYSVVLSAVLSLVFVTIAVSGATTIGSNISTAGTITSSGSIFASSTANAVLVTGQARFYDQLVFDSAAANPTADASGAVYFNSTERVLKMYDGVNWVTVASSTDANGGLILTNGIGVRFNSVDTNYMALGTTTLPVANPNSGNALLFLNATTSASVPLVIGAAKGSQTGDLFRIVGPTFSELFAIDSQGNASTTILSTSALVTNALSVSGFATTSGATGNIATEGTLAVTGATTLTGALTVNGAATLGDAAGDAIIITGNATTSNALTVRGLSFDVAGLATTTVSLVNGAATTTLGSIFGSAIGIGTTTPALSAKLGVVGSIHAGGTGTTSLKLHSSGTNAGTCIQMRTTNGVIIRIYATTTPTAGADLTQSLRVEAGTCEPI
ncbi:MAG: hypothetical protein HY457_03715 [Parcubacteria group bacterium]|nr:hypothetical protein [Parcubacteria group bacterium]